MNTKHINSLRHLYVHSYMFMCIWIDSSQHEQQHDSKLCNNNNLMCFLVVFFFIVFSSPISFHSFHCGFLLLVTLCAANKPCSVWNAANCGCRFTRALNLHIGHSSNIDGRIEVAAAVHYNATITLLCIFDECIQTKIHTNTQFLAAKYMKSRLEGDHISLLSIDNSSTYFI